ncbi:MAG: hypothetical protein P8Y60_14680 [Calditrichota bacterium]
MEVPPKIGGTKIMHPAIPVLIREDLFVRGPSTEEQWNVPGREHISGLVGKSDCPAGYQ